MLIFGCIERVVSSNRYIGGSGGMAKTSASSIPKAFLPGDYLQLWCQRVEAYAWSVRFLQEQVGDALLALLDMVKG